MQYCGETYSVPLNTQEGRVSTEDWTSTQAQHAHSHSGYEGVLQGFYGSLLIICKDPTAPYCKCLINNILCKEKC